MTNAMDTGISWMAAGAVVIFLIACVWHNRRTGYQRVRDEKITPSEAMARIRQSLAFRHRAAPTAERGPAHPLSQTKQLLSLSSILGNRRTKVEELRDDEVAAAHK